MLTRRIFRHLEVPKIIPHTNPAPKDVKRKGDTDAKYCVHISIYLSKPLRVSFLAVVFTFSCTRVCTGVIESPFFFCVAFCCMVFSYKTCIYISEQLVPCLVSFCFSFLFFLSVFGAPLPPLLPPPPLSYRPG